MSSRTGTFAFVPPLSETEVAAQVAGLLDRGLLPLIEHTAGSPSVDRIWTLWRLPLFGVEAADAVLAEVSACAAAYPKDRVRLVGYDRDRQIAAVCFETHSPT